MKDEDDDDDDHDYDDDDDLFCFGGQFNALLPANSLYDYGNSCAVRECICQTHNEIPALCANGSVKGLIVLWIMLDLALLCTLPLTIVFRIQFHFHSQPVSNLFQIPSLTVLL